MIKERLTRINKSKSPSSGGDKSIAWRAPGSKLSPWKPWDSSRPEGKGLYKQKETLRGSALHFTGEDDWNTKDLKWNLGTFLQVQWLRLQAFNAVGVSSIPGQGTKNHMQWGVAKKWKELSAEVCVQSWLGLEYNVPLYMTEDTCFMQCKDKQTVLCLLFKCHWPV